MSLHGVRSQLSVSTSILARVRPIIVSLARANGVAITAAQVEAMAQMLAGRRGTSQRDQVLEIKRLLGIISTSTAIAGPTIPAERVPVSIQLDAARATTAMRFGTAGALAPVPVSAGIFGSIGRVIGGAASGFIRGGPIGAIRGAVGGLAGPPQLPPPVPIAAGPTAGGIQEALRGGGLFGSQSAELGVGPFRARFQVGGGAQLPARVPAAAAAVPVVGGCPVGFHPNKTSYFLRSGEFVEVGSRCVRNRKRNPMNPRALSRAIARIESGKRVAKRLGRIRITKKCP